MSLFNVRKERRGFLPFFVLASLLMLMGIGLIRLNSSSTTSMISWLGWSVGWVTFLYGLLSWCAVELICRPPRNNAAAFQTRWKLRQKYHQAKDSVKPPVLVCVGDSISHGAASANFVNRVRPQLFQSLGMTTTKTPLHKDDALTDPLWVVNVAQNLLCSWTVYFERLPSIIACHPDYVLIMIGSNDVRAMYKDEYSKEYQATWQLPTPPNWLDYRNHLDGIIRFLLQSSPTLQIGLCTLPPLGEDVVQHPANELVRKANIMIQDLVAKQGAAERCTIVPVYDALTKALAERQKLFPFNPPPPMENFLNLALWMFPLYRLGFSWNTLSHMSGQHLFSDSIHLNEDAADIVANLIAEWLIKADIQVKLLLEPTK